MKPITMFSLGVTLVILSLIVVLAALILGILGWRIPEIIYLGYIFFLMGLVYILSFISSFLRGEGSERGGPRGHNP